MIKTKELAPKESRNDRILRTNLVEVWIMINESNNGLNETNKEMKENYKKNHCQRKYFRKPKWREKEKRRGR